MSRLSEEAWDRYVVRAPGVWNAARNDPMYRAQTSLFRQWLGLMDMVLEDNGVDREVRQQCANQMLYGTPNPFDAEARIEQTAAKAEELARSTELLYKKWRSP